MLTRGSYHFLCFCLLSIATSYNPIVVSIPISSSSSPLPSEILPILLVSRWKDSTLGSGADFFVPRVTDVRKLAMLLRKKLDGLGSNNSPSVGVLANCARFDVIVAYPHDPPPTVVEGVATVILSAAKQFDSKNRILFPGLSSTDDFETELSTLMNEIKTVEGVEDVLRYLCLTAAGMNSPKNRVFNPYNSRDSHILLQLKRVIQASAASGDGSNYVHAMIKVALSAGKIARDDSLIPEIKKLKRYAGRFAESTDPAIESSVKAVVSGEIDALIDSYLDKFETKDIVKAFRDKAATIGKLQGLSESEIKKYVHKATDLVRKKGDEDVERHVQLIRNEYNLGCAIITRNEAQLQSFVDQQHQWESLDEEDRRILEAHTEVSKMLFLLEDIIAAE